jgi:hypothetical protein
MADITQKTNFAARTLFIVSGFILFIVLIVFIFKLVPILVSGIGGAFSSSSKSNDAITITTTPETAVHQTPLVISFTHSPTQAGQYFISYTCVDGLFFDIQSTNGPQRIVCDTPFKLGGNVSQISLIPLITGSQSFVDTTFTVEYKGQDNKTIDSGKKIISITSTKDSQSTTAVGEKNPYNISGSLAGSSVTTTPVQNTQSTQSTRPITSTQPSTPASRDLVVTYIAAIPNQSAFVMHVYNYGNNSTGPWEFSYTDAENPSRTILSPIQATLGAGQGIAVNVRFDGQVNSSQTITIVLNPNKTINESNFTNNSSSVIITGRKTSSNTTTDYDFEGDADLVISSIKVGRMSGNRFIEDNSINDGDTAAIVFIAQNTGGKSTGSWRFEVQDIPYSSGNQTYRSSKQSSLRPGEYKEIIVKFDNADEGNYNIKVEVDSDDDVDEERENNNRRSKELDIN